VRTYQSDYLHLTINFACMITAYPMPPLVLTKLEFLLHSLLKARKAFEEMASSLKNRQLQHTIIGLAHESRQYATELDSYVHTLGMETEKFSSSSDFHDSTSESIEWAFPEEEKEVLRWCAKKEKSIVLIYREILNEPYLYEGIRKMVRYQLNGVMHSFAQLKLLNTSIRRG
jgi:uncharacterized protein (TIGR02284 family)